MSFEAEVRHQDLDHFLSEFDELGISPDYMQKHVETNEDGSKDVWYHGETEADAIKAAGKAVAASGAGVASILAELLAPPPQTPDQKPETQPQSVWWIKVRPYPTDFLKDFDSSDMPLENILDGCKIPEDDILTAPVPISDLQLRKLLKREAAALEGKETRLPLLFSQELKKRREERIETAYIAPEEQETMDEGERYFILADRILFKRLWKDLLAEKLKQMQEMPGGENLQLPNPTKEEIQRYSEKALWLAHLLIPDKARLDACRSAGLDDNKFEMYSEYFRAMYSPLPFMLDHFSGIRRLNKAIVESEAIRISRIREEHLKTNKDPLLLLTKELKQSFTTVRDDIASRYLGGAEYDGKDEKKVITEMYYSLLDEFDLRGQKERLMGELSCLEQQIEQEREAEEGSVIIQPSGVIEYRDKERPARMEELKRQISDLETQLEANPEPTNEQLDEARNTAVREISKLFKPNAVEPLSAKSIDEVREDYETNAYTDKKLWGRFSPLCRVVQIDEHKGEPDINPFDEKSLQKIPLIRASHEHIQASVADWKRRGYITRGAFKELLSHVIQDLQMIYLSSGNTEGAPDRYRHYSHLVQALSNPQLVAENIKATRNTKRADFDCLAQLACKRYLDSYNPKGQSDPNNAKALPEAGSTLERLRQEELSQALYEEAFKELEKKLKAEAGGRAPSKDELQDLRTNVTRKARTLAPSYTSSLETRYKALRGIKNLAADYQEMCRPEALVLENAREEKKKKTGSTDINLSELTEHLYQRSYNRFWKESGDSMPSPEQFYKIHEYATESARKALNQPDQQETVEPKEQMRFWKKHLYGYMAAVRNHKKELELKHKIAPKKEIEARYKRGWHRSVAEWLFVGKLYTWKFEAITKRLYQTS